MKNLRFLTLLSLLLVFFGVSKPVLAELIPTNIFLGSTSPDYGQIISLRASLCEGTIPSPIDIPCYPKSLTGPRLNGKTVEFYINGVSKGNATTDSTGFASVEVDEKIDAGVYIGGIEARFAGDDTYSATSFASDLEIYKINQTIIFNPLNNKELGKPDFDLTATASSNLPVSFQSLTTDTCTVNISTVHLVNVGTCTIEASQTGNNNYEQATKVNQSFTINPAITSSEETVEDSAGNSTTTTSSGGHSGTYVINSQPQVLGENTSKDKEEERKVLRKKIIEIRRQINALKIKANGYKIDSENVKIEKDNDLATKTASTTTPAKKTFWNLIKSLRFW